MSTICMSFIFINKTLPKCPVTVCGVLGAKSYIRKARAELFWTDSPGVDCCSKRSDATRVKKKHVYGNTELPLNPILKRLNYANKIGHFRSVRRESGTPERNHSDHWKQYWNKETNWSHGNCIVHCPWMAICHTYNTYWRWGALFVLVAPKHWYKG